MMISFPSLGQTTLTPKAFIRLLPVIAFSLGLAGCSGGSGEATTVTPNFSSSDDGGGIVLTGPPPQTADVQQFRLSLWENVAQLDRCGACHDAGGQAPTFARADDINLAYQAANSIVDLARPARSSIVTKVGSGHNCWQASDQACADIMTTWVSNWAGDAGGSETVVNLVAPALREPGSARSFPTDSTAFASTVHPVLRQYCVDCHRPDAPNPQSPFFAVADPDGAYGAERSKITIDDVASSRLVVRLASEFHNCWTDDCSADGEEMRVAIAAFVDGLPITAIDPGLVTSRALRLSEGVVASGGGRVDSNAIALYQFKTLGGFTAFDTSGVEPALNLNFSGDVSWVGGWGIRVGEAGKLQGATAASAKLHNLITATGEYSIEFWAAPGNVSQENARIVSYSGSTDARNFAVMQTLYNYNYLNRSSETDANGAPDLSTPDADEVLQATLQHVVATYDATSGRRLYVNGELIEVVDPTVAGNLSDWDDTFAFVLGNEVSGNRLWQGVLRLVAIHNRALDAEQVVRNFDAGVGERFLLLFGVEHLTGITDAFVVLEVSQFDNYSYLFAAPRLVSLSGAQAPVGLPLSGMRIGINGREPGVGQVYANLQGELGGADYSPESGQVLGTLGTVLGIEKGPESDEFFLTFDQIGENFAVRVDAVAPLAPIPADLPPQPEIGVRTFDEINATLAAITGVATSNPLVASTFEAVRQQLPNGESIDGFVSSQQMAITQLAIGYCNALVEDTSLRAAMFPGFDFNSAPAVALDSAGLDAMLTPLLAQVADGLGTLPDPVSTRAELENLAQLLSANGNNAARTQTVVKSTCAAALGSAAMLIQ